MGFDKPDLGFVVHLGAPSSPIAYYQQVGRAGRGVDRAIVVLLPGQEDQAVWEWFGAQAFPAEDQVRTALAALSTTDVRSVAKLETQVDLKRSRLESMLKVLDVDGAVRRVKGGWVSTGAAWEYDAVRYARVAQNRRDEQQSMLDYITGPGCRMAYLRNALDDPDLEPGWTCGRCDRCGGVEISQAPNPEAVAQARADMDRVGVDVTARRQWPSGMDSLGVNLRGRIAPSLQAAPGRAVARLDGLGWSGALRDLLAPTTSDGETPVPLRTAAVQVLDDWDAVRSSGVNHIEGIVAVRSSTRPLLVDHLSAGLARYLSVPLVGSIGPRAGATDPGRHDINSAMRLAGVEQRLTLEMSDAAREGLAGRSILLVDDYTDSGWTLAVAARLLREAGASAVYPFVLAVR